MTSNMINALAETHSCQIFEPRPVQRLLRITFDFFFFVFQYVAGLICPEPDGVADARPSPRNKSMWVL
jgi:hypothetical protein